MNREAATVVHSSESDELIRLRRLVRAIQHALGTEEYGLALVQVASDAHTAELENAQMQRDLEELASEIYWTAAVFDFQDTKGGEPLREYVARMVKKLSEAK